MDPGKLGGAYLAHVSDTPLKLVILYIPIHLTYFSLCGTNRPLRFCRQRGIAWHVGSIHANQDALIWWISVHQINIKAREQFIVVDCLSEILRLGFNRVFDDSWSDTWLHKDSPMKIGQAIIAGSWDCGPSKSRNLSRPKFLQRIGHPAFSC